MANAYLRMEDRKTIKRMYDAEVPVKEIAATVGKHFSSIYDELKRGQTGKMDRNCRAEYDPELAQRRAQESIQRRGNRKRGRKS